MVLPSRVEDVVKKKRNDDNLGMVYNIGSEVTEQNGSRICRYLVGREPVRKF